MGIEYSIPNTYTVLFVDFYHFTAITIKILLVSKIRIQ
jgi:hypothetical protein